MGNRNFEVILLPLLDSRVAIHKSDIPHVLDSLTCQKVFFRTFPYCSKIYDDITCNRSLIFIHCAGHSLGYIILETGLWFWKYILYHSDNFSVQFSVYSRTLTISYWTSWINPLFFFHFSSMCISIF